MTMRKVSETSGMPQMAVGSSPPADASDLPALGSAHPTHGVGKAPVGALSLVGRWQISPWLFFNFFFFFASENHPDLLPKAFYFPPL